MLASYQLCGHGGPVSEAAAGHPASQLPGVWSRGGAGGSMFRAGCRPGCLLNVRTTALHQHGEKPRETCMHMVTFVCICVCVYVSALMCLHDCVKCICACGGTTCLSICVKDHIYSVCVCARARTTPPACAVICTWCWLRWPWHGMRSCGTCGMWGRTCPHAFSSWVSRGEAVKVREGSEGGMPGE